MNPPYTENFPATQTQVALHLMINRLSVSKQPSIERRHNMLINEIPNDIFVNVDQEKLAAVIGRLLNMVISHSQDGQIRISAKSYGNVLLLHIKDTSRLNSPSFAGSLVDVQQMAEKIRGSVSVTSYRNQVTTIALSFVNAPLAA